MIAARGAPVPHLTNYKFSSSALGGSLVPRWEDQKLAAELKVCTNEVGGGNGLCSAKFITRVDAFDSTPVFLSRRNRRLKTG